MMSRSGNNANGCASMTGRGCGGVMGGARGNDPYGADIGENGAYGGYGTGAAGNPGR